MARPTPQGFRFTEILDAHRAVTDGPELTDDAAVAEKAGLNVALTLGLENNFKITTQEDLHRAEKILMTGNTEISGSVHVGSGFDVHRFVEGDHVTICGVVIPHDRGLAGHSDADVGLHSLTDAILGALGADDIGQLFPDDEVKWHGADSRVFVEGAVERMREAGYVVGNLDVTVILQSPKLVPHKQCIRDNLASVMDCDVSQVNVKGKSHEQVDAVAQRLNHA